MDALRVELDHISTPKEQTYLTSSPESSSKVYTRPLYTMELSTNTNLAVALRELHLSSSSVEDVSRCLNPWAPSWKGVAGLMAIVGHLTQAAGMDSDQSLAD